VVVSSWVSTYSTLRTRGGWFVLLLSDLMESGLDGVVVVVISFRRELFSKVALHLTPI
jgi:hypothetical protein